MKKIFTSIIAISLLASLTTTAFATNVTPASSESKDVTGTYIGTANTPDVYSVDISWEAMQFTYTVSGTHNWDATDHKYEDNVTGTWTSTTNKVTVVNHSNIDVTANVSFKNETTDSLTGSFTYEAKDTNTADGITLETAVGKAYADADKVIATLSMSGDLSETKEQNASKIGSIVVSVK